MSEGEGSSGTSGKKLIPQNCTMQLQTLRRDYRILLIQVLKFIRNQDSSPELKERRRAQNTQLRSHTSVLIRDLVSTNHQLELFLTDNEIKVRIEARIRQERHRLRKKSKQAFEASKTNETNKEIEDFLKRLKNRLDLLPESEQSKESF